MTTVPRILFVATGVLMVLLGLLNLLQWVLFGSVLNLFACLYAAWSLMAHGRLWRNT